MFGSHAAHGSEEEQDFLGIPGLLEPEHTLAVTFTKPGVYKFTTKAGEDFMSGVKTIGEDNVLRLTVTVR